jgi:hypothetical protein
MLEYKGTRLTIRYCERPPAEADAGVWTPESWREALQHIPAGKHAACSAKMIARRRQLADEGRLRSPDYWNTEGKLPDGKHFYAIKVDKLRAYGWFSTQHKGVFYISHFAFKKGQKLAQEDANRVEKNWRRIERNELEA